VQVGQDLVTEAPERARQDREAALPRAGAADDVDGQSSCHGSARNLRWYEPPAVRIAYFAVTDLP